MTRRAAGTSCLMGLIVSSLLHCLDVPTLTFAETDSAASIDSGAVMDASASVIDAAVESSAMSDGKPVSAVCPGTPPVGALACCGPVPCNGDCAAHCLECQSKCTSPTQVCCAKVAVSCRPAGAACN